MGSLRARSATKGSPTKGSAQGVRVLAYTKGCVIRDQGVSDQGVRVLARHLCSFAYVLIKGLFIKG